MFIAMAYYDGETLDKKISRGQLAINSAVDIAIQVARGLGRVHEAGITHRDIKPANIMITHRGEIKLLDFGLAKFMDQACITKPGTLIGTVAYMSPEQARSEEIDQRTDIWSLGVLLYEMIIGRLPFRGDSEPAMIYSILNEEPKPMRALRPDVPIQFERIVGKALAKNPTNRYLSIDAFLKELNVFRLHITPPQIRLWPILKRPQFAIPALLLFLAAAAAGTWFWTKTARVRWARHKALPEMARLIEEKQDYTAAFWLAVAAERYIPTDPMLLNPWPGMSRYISILTNSPGAEISIKEYAASDSEWQFLTKTPQKLLRIPLGFFHWKIQKSGYKTVETISFGVEFAVTDEHGSIPLSSQDFIPDEMVKMKGGRISLDIPGLFHLPPADLEDYLIDRYEVTNRQFKEFIDAGGYQNPAYWKHPFIKDGRELSWEEAIREFRDPTGRPGPSTWELGDYPEGRGDYPVTGISWYEAAAYCEFVGKRLPTIYHWNHAAGTTLSAHIIPVSNFTGNEVAAVGKFQGLGPYGTFDMAGNVKEWCWNQTENKRFILGGAWNEPDYMFIEADARLPFVRSPNCGFRSMKLLSENELPKIATDPISYISPDYRVSPVSEVEYQIYERLFTYDKTDLKALVENVDESAKNHL